MSMLSHLELQVSSARICQMEFSRFKNELVSNPSKFILHFENDTIEINKDIWIFAGLHSFYWHKKSFNQSKTRNFENYNNFDKVLSEKSYYNLGDIQRFRDFMGRTGSTWIQCGWSSVSKSRVKSLASPGWTKFDLKYKFFLLTLHGSNSIMVGLARLSPRDLVGEDPHWIRGLHARAGQPGSSMRSDRRGPWNPEINESPL